MQNEWKCAKCGRVFKMAAHLGRHMTTVHAQPRVLRMVSKPAAGTARKSGRSGSTGAIGGEITGMATDSLVALRRQIDQELVDRLIRGAV